MPRVAVPARRRAVAAQRTEARTAASRTFGQYDRDRRWFQDHRDELLKNHPEQWVAVYKEQLIAHATRLQELVVEIKKVHPAAANIVVEFVTKKPVGLML